MQTPDRERWRQADRLFDALLDLDESARTQRLRALAVQDPSLHALVQRLLHAHMQATGPLDQPPPQPGEPALAVLAGRRIGRWLLQQELGRGGMAVVFRAESLEEPHGQVAAVKVVTLGALAGLGQARFLQEQQALLRLRHPYIVPLYDAGTTEDGTPWLAMALVEGERIDAWCARRALDVEARVRLILQVGEALSYAHRNLVIHRDIKPSNVLVDEDGHVRLLDFGIARVVDGAAETTATALRALTPEYAAPEQFDGALPSTAMDVYGLGALGYRLLADVPPVRSATGQLKPPSRALRTDAPANASAVPNQTTTSATNPATGVAERRQRVRRLRGDLDTIVCKALATQPEQRYPSVDALLADLRRWLERRPIHAHPPSRLYAASRFVARHRLAAATTVAVAVLSGFAVTEVVQQRNRAEAEARRASVVRDFLAEVLTSAEPTDGGRIPDALDLLDDGSRRALDLLPTDPLSAADILTISGSARTSLSDYDRAQADLDLALKSLRQLQPAPVPELFNVHLELCKVHRVRGDGDREYAHCRQAVEWSRLGVPADDRIRAQAALGSTLARSRRYDEAEAMLHSALEQIPAAGLENTQLHLDAINAMTNALALARRDVAVRIPYHEQRLEIARRLFGENGGWYAYTLADSVPTLRRSPAHFAQARELANRAATITDRVYREPHLFAAVAHCNLAALLQQAGEHAPALAHYDRAIAIDTALGRNDRHAESCRYGRAYSRAAIGDIAGALADLESDRAMIERIGAGAVAPMLANCGLHASLLMRQGKLEEAKRVLARGDGAPVEEIARSLPYQQARAEFAWLSGQRQSAREQLALLRDQHRPRLHEREWWRPWALSSLAASGDATATDALRQQLREHAGTPALAPCLQAQDASACLRLP